MLRICQLDEFDRWIERMMRWSQIGVVGIMGLEVLMIAINWKSGCEDKILIYILNYLLFPTVRNIIIVGLGSIGVKLYLNKRQKIAAYIGFVSVSFMVCNVIYTHCEIVALMGVVGIPIILAVAMGDKRFLDHISLINAVLLLLIQIKLVQQAQLTTEVIVITIIGTSLLLVIFYGIARGIIEHYGDVLNCWSMASEIKKVDSLTGVLCKKAVCNELDEMIEDGKGSGMSVALIDIDNIGRIGEKYGQEKEAVIITEIGVAIKKIVTDSIKIGRYGKDEFILIFEKHGVMQVITICELVRDYICMQQVGGLSQGEVTISVGIATMTNKTEDGIELILKSKEALKKAKGEGKNKTVIS